MDKINGIEFKSMLISAGNNLYNHYPAIDNLNVFPVPDGDTGTNMNLTFSSGIKEIANLHSNRIGEVAKQFARGLLMGARGNSGVILSQIFKGIAIELENFESVDGVTLAKSFKKGKEIAYKAVMRPVEGTILTVIRESSDQTVEVVKYATKMVEVLKYMVDFANESLDKTPDLLPVLKEAGVVDSGGYGLVKILEGMYSYLKDEPIERITEDHVNLLVNDERDVYVDNHDGQFGYCTEFIVRLDHVDNFDEIEIRTYLEELGDSIVLVNDEDILKVHVHTEDPGRALSKAVTLGDMINIKVENMQEQADELAKDDVERSEQAIIAVSSGAGVDAMFKDLRVDKIISGGQTMNPSTEDFVKAIRDLNADNVIILPNNSNIILAAQQAAEVIDDVNVYVIPSKTIIQGMAACIHYNPKVSIAQNIDEMNEAIGSIKSGEVTYAVKNTKFNGHKIKKDDFIGIFEKELIFNDKDLIVVTKKLLDEMVDEDSELVTLITGKSVKQSIIDQVKDYVEDTHDVEVEIIEGRQPLYPFYIGVE